MDKYKPGEGPRVLLRDQVCWVKGVSAELLFWPAGNNVFLMSGLADMLLKWNQDPDETWVKRTETPWIKVNYENKQHCVVIREGWSRDKMRKDAFLKQWHGVSGWKYQREEGQLHLMDDNASIWLRFTGGGKFIALILKELDAPGIELPPGLELTDEEEPCQD